MIQFLEILQRFNFKKKPFRKSITHFFKIVFIRERKRERVSEQGEGHRKREK